MARITIKCDCGKETTIDVKTIDTLRKDLARMAQDRDYYRSKLAALELKIKSQPNEFSSLFDWMKFTQ